MLLLITRKEIKLVICDYPEEVKLTVVGFSQKVNEDFKGTYLEA